MKTDKHFTATTYLLHNQLPRTLLHFHKKLQTWLPPGGHLEENETPLEAARREVIEETGLNGAKVQFLHNGENPRVIDERAEMLAMPHFLLSELIEPGHYHLDWIYYAKISPDEFDHSLQEEEFRWFTIEDLMKESEIFANVRELAVTGIKKFC